MSDDVAASTVWRRVDGALTRRTPRSVLVAAPGTCDPALVEGAAIAVWDELDRPADDEQLVGRMAERLGSGRGDIHRAVAEARESLQRAGVIVEAR